MLGFNYVFDTIYMNNNPCLGDGKPVRPEEDVNKADRDCWCCNCGRRGEVKKSYYK